MTRRATVLALAAAAPLALVLGACLYTPPDQLPSSVRILYSKHDVDSLSESTDIWFVVAREGNELRLTDEETIDTQPFFAPGLRRVFFTRGQPVGREEIWSMDLDGNDEHRVLGEETADFRDPAVAPDGRSIAYTVVRGGQSQVMIADIDGSGARPLSERSSGWSQPAWSPDGRTVAVVSGEGSGRRILLVDVQGGAPRELAPASPGTQAEPDWSPDGSRIAFTSGSGRDAEIAVATVTGGALTLLTENDVEDGSPAWSTTGERIAFISQRPHGKGNLWLVDPDGEDLDDLTEYEEDDAGDPDWL